MREGVYPQVHEVAIKNIHDTGSALPLTDDIRKIRSVMGLSKESLDVSTDEEGFKIFKALAEDLPILSLIER